MVAFRLRLASNNHLLLNDVIATYIKRAYYYTYYFAYRLDLGTSPEGLRRWKAMAVILTAELFWVFIADLWSAAIVGRVLFIEAPRVVQISILIAIIIPNHYALRDDRWRVWANEFDHLSADRRKRWSWAIACGLMFTIFALAISFHIVGQKMRT